LSIRYEMSDRVMLSTEGCACGRPFGIVAAIDGRSEDVLRVPTANGGSVDVHPNVVHRAFEDVSKGSWQVVQESDRIRVVLAGTDPALDDRSIVVRLEGELRKRGRRAGDHHGRTSRRHSQDSAGEDAARSCSARGRLAVDGSLRLNHGMKPDATPTTTAASCTFVMRALACSLAFVGLVHCADGALPPRSTNDPANPNAPESPFVRPSHPTASTAPVATVGSAQPGVVYACPMGHGTWAKPGKCPVCGMTLVERKTP